MDDLITSTPLPGDGTEVYVNGSDNITVRIDTDMMFYNSIMLFFVSSVVVGGNSLIITLITIYRDLRVKEFYIPLTLAFGDLTYGVGCFLNGIANIRAIRQGHFRYSIFECQTRPEIFCLNFGGSLSALMFLMLSVERYFAISYPMDYRAYPPHRIKNACIVGVIYSLLSIIVGIVLAYVKGQNAYVAICAPPATVWEFNVYRIGHLMTCGILCVVVYVGVIFKMFRGSKMIKSDDIRAATWERQVKVTKTLGIVIFMTFICYDIPMISAFFVFAIANLNRGTKANIANVVGFFLTTNCANNAFVYLAKHQELREACKKLFTRCGGQKVSPEQQATVEYSSQKQVA